MDFKVGKTILYAEGGTYYVAVISFIGPDFLMVTVVKQNNKVYTVRISKGQVQTIV